MTNIEKLLELTKDGHLYISINEHRKNKQPVFEYLTLNHMMDSRTIDDIVSTDRVTIIKASTSLNGWTSIITHHNTEEAILRTIQKLARNN